jgi:hypothetical protein
MEKCILIRNRNGQVWSFDLLVALMIFVVGLLIIYFFALNYKSSAFDELNELYYDGDLVSSLIMGDGPESLITNNHVDQSKLDYFNSLSDSEKKIRFGVSNNFYFSIPNMVVDGVSQQNVGVLNTSVVSSQIKTTRIVIYNNKPEKMEVVVWR